MRWCSVASTTSTMTSIGGVVQRGLGDGRGVMDSHKVGALSGAMVASTANLARVLASIFTLEVVWGKMAVATARVCAQGAISGVGRRASDG